VMDASRCIAYLNIELKGPVPERFRAAMGANVFGCDICQDVCPWNSKSPDPEARNQNGAGQPRAVATTFQPEFQPLALTVGKLETGNLKIAPRDNAPAPRHARGNRQPATVNRQSPSDSRLPTPDSRVFSLFHPPLEALASLSEEEFREAFRHSPIRRAKYLGWLRNLCVAMGNSGEPRFLPKLRELARHPDPLVREHAVWALQRLGDCAHPPDGGEPG
jgi:epoxyqueuosine reductase